MKRIFFAIAVMLLLVACSAEQPAAPSEPSAPAEPSEPSVIEQETYVPEEPTTIEETMPEERTRLAEHQSPDLVKAFQDGMNKCSYMLDGIMYTAWILEEDRFRFEKAISGQRVSAIYDGDVVHSWDDRTKQGVRLNIADLSDERDKRIAGIDIPITPEAIKTDKAERVVCVESTAIGETILEVPGNVDFTDVGDIVADDETVEE
jgi:hypothetical protein